MNYKKSRELGSKTSKDGFKNENDIINKFNNWQSDEDAKKWLLIMQYKLNEIEYVKAIKISGEKTDVQIQITIKLKKAICAENLQVKLVSNKKGFNQIDKRWLKNYDLLWNIPKSVYELLQHYTGEVPPKITSPKDKRRMFANEFFQNEQELLKNFLTTNKTMIISDILKGRGRFSAEWMLVIRKLKENTDWVLKPMNFVLNYYTGDVEITKQGNFKIGKITMQRKGGDNGRETAKMLQFKINPAELFE
ncbi:MAG: hypothetical protein PHC64_05715 [Candidatus Gastranaerophilales bacterium]|nr:hypothetical protein [Candidatus Gastranaerophilales bacterium]